MGPRGSDRPALRGEGLPRRVRIRRGTEIRRLLRNGVRGRGRYLDVFTLPGSSAGPRFGTIVPRYGRRVVERNRLRRRLREVGRREILPALRKAGRGIDVLVRARPPAYGAAFSTLRIELLGLTEALWSDMSPSA